MTDFRSWEQSPELDSGLNFVTLKSQHLNGRGDISFYQGPTPPKAIVILLHGVYGSHWSWPLLGEAHLIAAKMIQDQKISSILLAMPSDGLAGDGSAYSTRTEVDYEQWICQDVINACKKFSPNLSPNLPIFIGGLSMGGFGAMRLAFRHPHLFSAVSAHSAITRIEEFKDFIEEDIEQLNLKQELIDLAIERKSTIPPLRFDCGMDDQLIAGNRKLHRALKEQNIQHYYEEFSGGHDWSYWKSYLTKSLQFFEQILKNKIKG